MEFKVFIEWVFYGAMGFAALRTVRILDKLNDSVSSLNIKFGIMLYRADNHEERIKKLEDKDAR